MLTRFTLISVLLSCLLSVEASATVGRTVGHFVVTPTGSAHYTIPIFAPPGPRGMQPNISLVYDSQSEIGPLGIGWSLAGLGSITRCNLTVAQDTVPAPVALVAGDGYCINGKRLRLTSGTYGTAGSTYQTEIADFSNITAIGTAGNGPQNFTVQGRNGLTYYYGATDANGNGANSEVLASGSTTALTWLLSKVVDRSGNNYVINYTALTGTAVPNYILWTPSSAGAATYQYKMLFVYNTGGSNTPASSIYAYVAGTPVIDTQLLSSIQILVGTTVVKDYFLGYQISPLTGRKELISVKECADSAGANCLIPTTVGYQTGSPGVSTVSNTAPSGGNPSAARYDFNGDGYPDLVFKNGSTWYVAFGSALGFGTPISTSIVTGTGPTLFGNLLGGHMDGILASASGTWVYYQWNGSGFASTSTGLPYDSTSKNYVLADVNGDGLPDLVSQKDTSVILAGHTILTSVISTRLNTSSATLPSFSATLNTAFTRVGALSVFLQGPDAQFGKMRRYDFNGDGRDDLVVQIETSTLNTYELISTGTSFTAALISTIPAGGPFTPIYFTNWNDDKCTDFVASNTLYISGCDGTATITYPLAGNILLGLDWDGDGRTDILVQNGTTIGVYLSQATSTAPTLTPTSVPYTSSCTYVWMDANGDGLDDLGCFSTSSVSYYLHNGTSDLATSFADGYGNSASPTYIPISEGAYTEHGYGEATFPDADYIGPMNVVSQVIFSDPSAAPGTLYSQSFQYFGAWTNLQGRGFDGFGATYVLDSRNNVGRSKFYQRAFPYTGMMYNEVDQKGSQFLKSRLGTTHFTALSLAPNQQRYFPYFNNWSDSRYEIGYPASGNPVTTTTTNYTFDNYGNATKIVRTVTDNDPGSPIPNPYFGDSWTTTVTNTPDISVNAAADLAAWCLPLLDQTQILYSATINGTNTVTRTQEYFPDTTIANCRISSVITEPSSTTQYKVTEALTFDSFGNVATDTTTGVNMPSSPASRLVSLNWGTTGQFLNTETDPSGATTTWTYTSDQALTFGVPDNVKNANNLTTSWTYDVFGRKTKETRPDTTSTQWVWSACVSFCGWSNSVYQIAQTAYQTNGTTAIRTDTNFYDPVDRVTESSGATVTGSTAIVQKLYNSLGLLTQESIPFISGATAYQQTFTYDALNRPLSMARPTSSMNLSPQSTNYSYTGRTKTVTDPKGNVTTLLSDVNGSLRRTTDAVGYAITRAYDAAGTLNGVTDSVGNTLLGGVTINYGIKPFRVAATDADLGAWVYTYDSLGERIGWSDAKAQSFAMTYDALSRPVTRKEPDLFTQWTYGSTPASANVGQLISECTGQSGSPPISCGSPVYLENRYFDSAGRPSIRAITLSAIAGNDTDPVTHAGGVFLFANAYSTTTGLPSALTYPKSASGVAALNLQYAFQFGLLQSVTDTTDTTTTCGTSCTLWTANVMNAFGETTQETLGNGVVSIRTYDAVTSWLSKATGGVGGGSALLNQTYTEDDNGNVIERQNNNTPGLTESFFYDADNRLICATLAGSCSTNTFVYDGGSAGPGNITTQVGVGTYTYPAAGQPRPHAVTSLTGTFNGIVNPSFSYDANGNMTNRANATQNVYWTSFNYPSSITATDVSGSEVVSINYGPDRQRIQQNFNGSSGYETTFYIGGLMDIVILGTTTDYRHYIYDGNEPIAIYSRTAAGVNTMSYMLEDHQRSISTIASKTGAVDVNESFSAFGARRNPATWSGAPTTTDLNTIAGLSRQGYTFQTWLGQSMGLNHMNGRVEDAILGRFLSPDPHITNPGDSQSYNRYTYVNNNPLTLTDPTGFVASECLSPGGVPQIAPCGDGGSLGVSSTGGSIGGDGGSSQQDDPNLDPVDVTASPITGCDSTLSPCASYSGSDFWSTFGAFGFLTQPFTAPNFPTIDPVNITARKLPQPQLKPCENSSSFAGRWAANLDTFSTWSGRTALASGGAALATSETVVGGAFFGTIAAISEVGSQLSAVGSGVLKLVDGNYQGAQASFAGSLIGNVLPSALFKFYTPTAKDFGKLVAGTEAEAASDAVQAVTCPE